MPCASVRGGEGGDSARRGYERSERRVPDAVLDTVAVEVAAFAGPERIGGAGEAAVGESVTDADHMRGSERAKLRDRHALARAASVAAQLGRSGAGGEAHLQAFGAEEALVRHHPHVAAQIGGEVLG